MSFSSPSGASTGVHEVAAWPEGGPGVGVIRFEEILTGPDGILGHDSLDQPGIDAHMRDLDGTETLAHIGGNVIVATSLAIAKAAADESALPLWRYLGGPFGHRTLRPFGNCIGGGQHAIGGTDVQEFMAVPKGETMTDSIFALAQVHKAVGKRLKEAYPTAAIGKGDEGAWVCRMGNEQALKTLRAACDDVGSRLDMPIDIALDVAASEFFVDGRYVYRNMDG